MGGKLILEGGGAAQSKGPPLRFVTLRKTSAGNYWQRGYNVT